MIFIGMIYQYDSEEGTGLLMLSDGEKKEFNISQWVDSINEPKIAQKISYEIVANRAEIKAASEEDIARASVQKEEEESPKEETASSDSMKQFANLDDCLEYFRQREFKLVKDTPSDESRVLTLRKYTPTEYGEAIITERESKLSIELSLNGKPAVIA